MTGARVDFGQVQGPRIPSELLDTPHWYALRTRARAEKSTHALLDRSGVESFAAIAEVERVWADRTRVVGMPLFSGYIFVRIALVRAVEALRVPGAVELVKVKGLPAPLRNEEMDAVMQLARGVSEARALPTEADWMTTGVRVRVREGPFRGLQGVLVEKANRTYVSVRIAALRQAKGVRIDRALLERVTVHAA